VIERRVIADDTIGGFAIPRGSSLLISPYLLHRHPEFWPTPETFDPSRFVGPQPRPRDGYLPFGLGEHRCVGLHLATKMAMHIIQRVFAETRLTLLFDQHLQALPGITLQHHSPVTLRVEARMGTRPDAC
jgi:cytochrome P450